MSRFLIRAALATALLATWGGGCREDTPLAPPATGSAGTTGGAGSAVPTGSAGIGAVTGAAGPGAAGTGGAGTQAVDAGNDDGHCCLSDLGATSCSVNATQLFTCVVGGPNDSCPSGKVWQVTNCPHLCTTDYSGQGGAGGPGISGGHCQAADAEL